MKHDPSDPETVVYHWERFFVLRPRIIDGRIAWLRFAERRLKITRHENYFGDHRTLITSKWEHRRLEIGKK